MKEQLILKREEMRARLALLEKAGKTVNRVERGIVRELVDNLEQAIANLEWLENHDQRTTIATAACR